MAEPGDERAAAGGGRGRLRASHADREKVIELLKTAFVQDRLSKDELDTRVGQAFASQTYAELAAITADIPAEPAAARPLREPVRAKSQAPLAVSMVIAMTMLTAGSWMGALFYQDEPWGMVVFIVTLTWLGIVILAGAVMLESRNQKRSTGQPPPRPARGLGGQASRRPSSAGPGGQLPPAGHGQQHSAEAARGDLVHPQSPGSRSAHQWRHRGHRYTIGYAGS